ncbi:MAG: hypothetical protein JO210_04035 [Acidobacteriaceae bacterium]|nr:hypothetical protein [Acidobacteriaceae bacterium]
MTKPYLDHPNEEALERFLLQRSEESELEVLETHILACETCITRLETLELQIANLKAALATAEEQAIQKELNRERFSWKSWFTVSSLSWAGAACAALAVGLAVVPLYTQHNLKLSNANSGEIAEGDLSACRGAGLDTNLATCRGAETTTLPEGRPLDLRLDTTDIPQGPVDVQVVNGAGADVWQGQTTVTDEHARVRLPEISQPGTYFLRFYAPSASAEHELLREFRFEVK